MEITKAKKEYFKDYLFLKRKEERDYSKITGRKIKYPTDKILRKEFNESVSSDKNLKKGTLTWLFVLMYGILRFLIEFSKEPTSYVLGIPTGQIFSFLMIIAGGYFLLRK